MNRKFHSILVGTLAVAGVGMTATAFIPQAHADAWDKKTYVTVNEPIIAGNKVLDPGTYVWKLMDSPSERHVVQIFDKDQQHLQTTVIAIPNYRLHPTGNSQFAFWETPAGVPKAVRAWFYPGDNFGQEFTYPKKLVAQLASAAPVPVPMNYREPEPEPQPAPEPAAQPEPAPAPAPAPAAQPQPQAQESTPAAQPAQPQALPHTASSTPLVGLLGFICLSLAGLLTLTGKKTSPVRIHRS
jgi:hypothetical protein